MHRSLADSISKQGSVAERATLSCLHSALGAYWKVTKSPCWKTVLSSIKCCRKPFWRKEEEDKLLQQNSTSRTVDSTFEFEIQTDWFFTIKGRLRSTWRVLVFHCNLQAFICELSSFALITFLSRLNKSWTQESSNCLLNKYYSCDSFAVWYYWTSNSISQHHTQTHNHQRRVIVVRGNLVYWSVEKTLFGVKQATWEVDLLRPLLWEYLDRICKEPHLLS